MYECPCGSGRAFEVCCQPVMKSERPAETAEALMRSRYSAFVEHDVRWLGESLHPDHRHDWDEAATQRWAEGAQWLGLEIKNTEAGLANDQVGVVEFIARFKDGDKIRRHVERANFKRHGGLWYYVDGEMPKVETYQKAQKVGRNDPCPCGSGKKYKKCCGANA